MRLADAGTQFSEATGDRRQTVVRGWGEDGGEGFGGSVCFAGGEMG
ncbi:hypothetical protein [Streptomyces sp. NPDC058683]